MEAQNGILIDTNVFVDYFRNFPASITFFDSLSERQDVFFSAITETELFAGKGNDVAEKRALLVQFLQRWRKVAVGNPVAAFAGDVSRECSLGIPDAIIAASAVHHKLVLLTKNVRHFRNVSGLFIREPY